MNRRRLHEQVGNVLAARLGPTESIEHVVGVWAAQAPPGAATFFTRRRPHAVALTATRLVVLEPARPRTFEPVVDRPYGELTALRRGTPGLLRRVAFTAGDRAWFVEFRRRDRAAANALVERLGTAAADASSNPTSPSPRPPEWAAALEPPPATTPDPPAPAAPPRPEPSPDAVLRVLAMGDPAAVPLLAELASNGFPAPPDPLPVVDRLSVRSVAGAMQSGTATTTAAQRWAVVVQRALRSATPPLELDRDDPFPDQLVGAIKALAALRPDDDPAASARHVEAILAGETR